MIRSRWFLGATLALIAVFVLVPASALAKKKETVDVCKHGCDFRTIQDAVDADRQERDDQRQARQLQGGRLRQRQQARRPDDPGHEEEREEGRPRGQERQDPDGLANNGIEGDRVNGLRILNLTAQNYLANGFFVHGEGSKPCDGYLMKNLIASFNRAYGLFAFNCIGGRMTESVGYGHGDSAFYVGETPAQDKPKWTKLDHNSRPTRTCSATRARTPST